MRGLLLVVVAAALGGCATSGESSYARKSGSAEKDRYVVDVAYVKRAMHVARMRGVELTWVNYPYVNPNQVPKK